MTTKFPTQSEFLAWWKGKRDAMRSFDDRSTTCPIALYLREHEFPFAWVADTKWSTGYHGASLRKLPFWAIRVVNHFDLDLEERARRIGGLR